MMQTITLTKMTTRRPSRNHSGESPTVSASRMNPAIMMVANAPSMVICISSAAEVAFPASMPRLRASLTTSVVPARFNDGAIVFMKKVPNTKGSVERGFMRSSTALKQ